MKNLSLALAALLTMPLLSQAEVRAPKMVLGWLETTELMPSGLRVKTKLDPGAKTSSMQATNIEQFQRNGKPWVRFVFTSTDIDSEKEHTLHLEGPLVREVIIKRHGAKSVTRPVISQDFCLYNQVYRTQFSLTDRGKFNYPVLLGRTFLANTALVDSSAMFLSRPACESDTSVLVIGD